MMFDGDADCDGNGDGDGDGDGDGGVDYMSISEVHDVGSGAALPVSQADAVLQDHVRGIVPP